MSAAITHALLRIQVATLFETNADGRIVRSAGPDHAPAPRLHLAIGAQGAIVRVRDDVELRVAREIEALAARELPIVKPQAFPRFVDDYRRLLGVGEPVTDHHFGVIHSLPHGTRWTSDVALVSHGTDAGHALVARIARDGMPAPLVDAGFVDLSHFWEPWCLALKGDDIVALAFAVRLGDKGAELGVNTLPGPRGRGYGAAVTAGWSALPSLQHVPLFYATHRDNHSSQRVIARLGLPFLGIRLQF